MFGMEAMMFFANKVREEREERARLGIPEAPPMTREESARLWLDAYCEPNPLMEWMRGKPEE